MTVSDWVDDAALGLSLPAEVRFYRQMRLIREVEQRLLSLLDDDAISGTTHTCMGQEANAVGVIGAIDRSIDTIWSNHRCHGHFLAYCGRTEGLLAEILGRTSGVCGGRGGSQHLCHGRFHSNGIQGGIAPLAVGTAIAERDKGALSVVFLGDGTMGEGTLYEALNLAALWTAPVLFVVEDNAISQTTPKSLGVSGDIARRADPFAIPSYEIDSTDVTEIHALALEAAGQIRQRGGPAWLVIRTHRIGPHSKGDDTRSLDIIAAARAADPLDRLRPRLGAGAAGEQDSACRRLVDDALEKAREAPVACG